MNFCASVNYQIKSQAKTFRFDQDYKQLTFLLCRFFLSEVYLQAFRHSALVCRKRRNMDEHLIDKIQETEEK